MHIFPPWKPCLNYSIASQGLHGAPSWLTSINIEQPACSVKSSQLTLLAFLDYRNPDLTFIVRNRCVLTLIPEQFRSSRQFVAR